MKKVLFSVLVLAFFAIGAFVLGTFYPNALTVDKIENQMHKQELKVVEDLGLREPEFEFNDKDTFMEATRKCVAYLNWTTDRMNRVPTAIIVGMAGIESAWGISRFAKEGNNLFGIRTWDLENTPHMKAKGNPDASWGLKKYKTKCDSVRDMIRILNTHPAYEGFRLAREKQIILGKWEYKELLLGMTAWSTNEQYVEIILDTIVKNKLH